MVLSSIYDYKVSTKPRVSLPTNAVINNGISELDSYINSAKDLMADERAYNSAEAEKNRLWQERMSNTAYTRAVEDLRNAGLNPYLAITNGGATTTTGASASHSGISSAVLSGLISNFNTILNNQTARDNAVLSSNTSKEIAFMNNLTKIFSSFVPHTSYKIK